MTVGVEARVREVENVTVVTHTAQMLISVEEAQAILASAVRAVTGYERVKLAHAFGRIIAE